MTTDGQRQLRTCDARVGPDTRSWPAHRDSSAPRSLRALGAGRGAKTPGGGRSSGRWPGCLLARSETPWDSSWRSRRGESRCRNVEPPHSAERITIRSSTSYRPGGRSGADAGRTRSAGGLPRRSGGLSGSVRDRGCPTGPTGLKPLLSGLIDRNGPPPAELSGVVDAYVVQVSWAQLQPERRTFRPRRPRPGLRPGGPRGLAGQAPRPRRHPRPRLGQAVVSAANLMTMFLALEWFSIALYVLCALDTHRRQSLEAGLKYLIVGSFGSGILLFGCALVYGATGGSGSRRSRRRPAPTTRSSSRGWR